MCWSPRVRLCLVLLFGLGWIALVVAPAGATSSAAGASPAVAPLGASAQSLVVTRPFAAPPTPYGAGHRGVDLAAAAGAVVHNALTGQVVFVGTVAGVPVISVDVGDGQRLTYEPVAATVAVGDRLVVGQPLGTLLAGHPGCPVAACLHWGLLLTGTKPRLYADPMGLLGMVAVRLLPWVGEPEPG